ncbi:MAG: signal peptidase I [Candidatus Nealsonbacteria bacterium CG10_big_fil_rev_8_21_14_0_10_36_24]|uniref:Signal peptidase I n=2 Tax=Candidatus Nealsoniibacteriota TaxID=1817911 RepID=A0A2H0YNP6_9BACT|nr:MAG: signal peptidase I [Candidatus Nealsonbacteria bacterium CG10_big_fil_rev_8_21_14_0_10_36_24]PIS40124.1 MAG: signal peptidase I [Candidatus Nealsonbacteria bacterium CG08_land_8_20_14_0_20_36_22]
MIKKVFSFIWEIAKIVIIAIVIVVPIRYFLFQPFFVRGQSMDPNFENGDYLLVDEITYRFKEPQRGEVIVFKSPLDSSQRFIKRIIGLPGEIVEIKDGRVIVYNDKGQQVLNELDYLPNFSTGGDLKISLGENEYFVLGDNRPFSYDSRRFGPVLKESIIGRVIFRAWPFATLMIFEKPSY